MSGCVNKVILVGLLGRDPEVRAMQDGRSVCNFSIATTDTWRDKTTGERRERTEWHNVVIFNDGLVNVAQQYLHKGSKVYVEGALQTRKWEDREGQTRYTTEVVLQGYSGTLAMLDRPNDNQKSASQGQAKSQGGQSGQASRSDVFADEIPF